MQNSFGLLRSVLRAAAVSTFDTRRIQRATNDVVADTGEILDAPTANQNNGVLLERMTDTGNVRIHLIAVGQANTRDLTKGRVRLLWRLSKNAQANSAALRRLLEIR